jgi:hypothetical protein
LLFIYLLTHTSSFAYTNEFIEIASPAKVPLTGYSVLLYNGANVVYSTTSLDSIVTLVGPLGVVEFLSYEGPITATTGPANGLTSMTATTTIDVKGITTLYTSS